MERKSAQPKKKESKNSFNNKKRKNFKQKKKTSFGLSYVCFSSFLVFDQVLPFLCLG